MVGDVRAGLAPPLKLRRTAEAPAEAGQACPQADLKVRSTRNENALAAGEISRPRLDRGAPAADAHVELVPAVLRHARGRVADQIALTEFVEDAEERRG